ncbi:hypothetical protein D3C87_1632770 [compost metagenome]
MCLPGYRGACQGGAKIRAQADRRPPAGLYPDNCLLHQHVQAGIGYRGAQRGQRLVRFVHEQRHGIFATVDADPLVEFSDHRFRAAVAVLLDCRIDVFVGEGMGGVGLNCHVASPGVSGVRSRCS